MAQCDSKISPQYSASGTHRVIMTLAFVQDGKISDNAPANCIAQLWDPVTDECSQTLTGYTELDSGIILNGNKILLSITFGCR